MLALMIFKHQKVKGMADKPVIVFDRKDAEGRRFWSPLIKLLGEWCYDGEFVVVNELSEIIPRVQKMAVK